MSTARFRPILLVSLILIAALWSSGLGLLALTVGDPVFPASESIDLRYSARPGVNLQPADLVPMRLGETLAGLAQADVSWVRFTLPWDEVEPERGQFRWTSWDTVLSSLSLYPRLQPIVVLDRSPEWARSEADAGNPLAPPHERADFGAFARAVVERYGDRLTYYQVWHEPNIAPHWGAGPADPAGYLGLLREAAVALRAVDPDAKVIAAALAPTLEEGGANLSDLMFLDRLYELGGRSWFDFPAVQPYGFAAAPDDAPAPGKLNFGRAFEARQVMLRHGDAETPLWATAFGWNASASGSGPSPWGNVDPASQAAFTSDAFAKAGREWPWLGPIIWTAYFPAEPATLDILAGADSSPTALPPGSHRPDHPALRYSDGWRVTPSAADPSAAGDAIAFSFQGTGVALNVQGGPYWAYLTVSVDGGPANRLPRDEWGASYLVLHDPSSARRLVPLATGLRSGEHTAHVAVTGGWGQWAIQGVVVTAAEPASQRIAWVLLGLALVSTAALAAAVWRWVRIRTPANVTGPPAAPTDRGIPLQAELPLWLVAVALLIIFLVSSATAIDLLSLALLGLLFVLRPTLAPPLIAASLPFWQRTEPVLRWQFGLFEIVAWIGLAAWIARLVLDSLVGDVVPNRMVRRHRWWFVPGLPLLIDITVFALFASGLIASLFAAEQGVAWREFRIVFLFGLALFWLITRIPSSETRGMTASLVTGLLAGATIAGTIGLWQAVTGEGRVDVEGVGRIAALYGSPNNLALLLDRAVPLALTLALLWTRPPGLGRAAGGMWAGRAVRLVLIAVLIVTVAAAIATFSKGALLLGLPAGLAVVLLGSSWRSGRRGPLWILAGLILCGAAGMILLFRTQRFADLFNFEGGTSFLRLKLWRGALNMALDHPLLGVGPDNFLYAYRTRYVLPSGWQELNLSHPHNILLDLWTRLGALGVVSGLSAIAVAFVAGWHLLKRNEPMVTIPALPGSRDGEAGQGRAGARPVSNWDGWPLALGLLGGLAATVAHGLIDNSLFLPDLMGWFVAALGLAWLRFARGEG